MGSESKVDGSSCMCRNGVVGVGSVVCESGEACVHGEGWEARMDGDMCESGEQCEGKETCESGEACVVGEGCEGGDRCECSDGSMVEGETEVAVKEHGD